jgi:hypothetical protein
VGFVTSPQRQQQQQLLQIRWTGAFVFIGEKGSIPPTLYEQLLHSQIPEAQKTNQLKQFFALSGSVSIKAACKHDVEIVPWRFP